MNETQLLSHSDMVLRQYKTVLKISSLDNVEWVDC